jgi:ADP-ribosylglycohydrolase
MDILKDKIMGMFQGHLMGDALGAPHEFRYNKNTYKFTGILQHPIRMMSRFQGQRFGVVGQYTDDGEMTLTLLRSLIRNKGYNKNDVILSYERWANTGGAMGMGKNTRELFKGVTTINGFQKRWNNKFQGKEHHDIPQSNGSLMRCSPLALLNDDNCIITDCELSNPNNINRDASNVYVSALKMALAGNTKDEIISFIKQHAQTEEVKITLTHAIHKDGCDPSYKFDQEIQPYMVDSKLKGWVLIALYVAIRLFYYTDNYQDAVNKAIRLQGDTDTNAAITGALCGAYYGSREILSNNTTIENWNIILKAQPNKGNFNRLPEHSPYDLHELVDQVIQIFYM